MGFFAVVGFLGVWVLPHPVQEGFLKNAPFIRHFGFGHLLSLDGGDKTTLTLLLYALLMGLLAHEFGFHPAIGAYMAGLILKEEYFISRQVEGSTLNPHENSRRLLDDVAFSWIGPVFFVELGTRLVFHGGLLGDVLPGALLLFAAFFLNVSVPLTIRWWKPHYQRARSVAEGDT